MREMEFKWRAGSYDDFKRLANTARRFGASLGHESRLRNRDYYLDTLARDLRRAAAAARIRNSGSLWEFTFKTASPLRDGLASREEITATLAGAATFSSALKLLHSGAARCAELPVPAGELEQVFTIDTRRRQRIMDIPGGTRASAVYDDSQITAGGLSGSLREMELEFLSGDAQGFMNFARKLAATAGFSAVTASKVATALDMEAGKYGA